MDSSDQANTTQQKIWATLIGIIVLAFVGLGSVAVAVDDKTPHSDCREDQVVVWNSLAERHVDCIDVNNLQVVFGG